MTVLRKFAFAIVIAALSFSAFAEKRASFGFGSDAETTGFFLNPTLQRVWISSVESGSPAQKAGLLVNDVLLTANGRPLTGTPAKDMASLMRSFKPGDHLRLKVDRSGKTTTIDIVAGTR